MFIICSMSCTSAHTFTVFVSCVTDVLCPGLMFVSVFFYPDGSTHALHFCV